MCSSSALLLVGEQDMAAMNPRWDHKVNKSQKKIVATDEG
jgi:hypothetical protein